MGEARKTHLRQMAGTAVSMLLQPSRGIRDDIERLGGTPKDHRKVNRQRLKDLEKANKAKLVEAAIPPPEPFKLKRFESVPAKLNTRRTSVRIVDRFARMGWKDGELTECKMFLILVRRREPLLSHRRKSTSSKNYISINSTKAKKAEPRAPPAAEPHVVERKTRNGEIPKYLVNRKMEWAQQELDRLNKLEEDKIPPGMMVVPDEDKQRTLRSLRQKQDQLMDQLARFPVVTETLGMQRRKAIIEAQLKEIEEAIETFSRKVVFVAKDVPEYQGEPELRNAPTGVGVWDRAQDAAAQRSRKTSIAGFR
ncbi:calmodulin-binding-domain-containing protein [Fimicolochytrium jonesii]|uniref:calmodulin-binding-domain-containing protein n=1 Tax=Fimicolochytrium jonesii TaxID=1396493 RepID=UPI0022FEA167|nr:calmodulin-binding-domain-containing protein [Fimicolochytrium jonesii]KAI8825081.1 calmodulin-binding-domain-containing protein [Fimicolochytrium jonesii]